MNLCTNVVYICIVLVRACKCKLIFTNSFSGLFEFDFFLFVLDLDRRIQFVCFLFCSFICNFIWLCNDWFVSFLLSIINFYCIYLIMIVIVVRLSSKLFCQSNRWIKLLNCWMNEFLFFDWYNLDERSFGWFNNPVRACASAIY